MEKLQHLDLSHNHLTGSLLHLQMSHINLTGSPFHRMASLTSLDLSHNEFSSTIPTEIGLLTLLANLVRFAVLFEYFFFAVVMLTDANLLCFESSYNTQ